MLLRGMQISLEHMEIRVKAKMLQVANVSPTQPAGCFTGGHWNHKTFRRNQFQPNAASLTCGARYTYKTCREKQQMYLLVSYTQRRHSRNISVRKDNKDSRHGNKHRRTEHVAQSWDGGIFPGPGRRHQIPLVDFGANNRQYNLSNASFCGGRDQGAFLWHDRWNSLKKRLMSTVARTEQLQQNSMFLGL